MNRTTRTVIKLFLIAATTIFCTAAAYYICSNLTGHSLATASENMNYSRWLEKFFALTRATGLLNGICALIWFISARFLFKIDEAAGAGKRIIWAAFLCLSMAISAGIPHFYAPILGIKLNGIIFGLFLAIFSGIGYWILTIFTTPLAFKYTPLGARLFGRKL